MINYEVITRLGQGAQGSVYLAQHRSTGKYVAIKVVPSAAPANNEINALRLRPAEQERLSKRPRQSADISPEPAIALDDPLHPSYQPFLWEEDLVDIWDRIATSEDTIADISLVEDVNPGITALLSYWENGTAQGLSSENGVEQPEGGVLLNEKDDVEEENEEIPNQQSMSMMDDPTPPGTPATSTAFPPSPVKRQRNSDADEPEEKRRKFGPEETPPRLEIGPEEYVHVR